MKKHFRPYMVKTDGSLEQVYQNNKPVAPFSTRQAAEEFAAEAVKSVPYFVEGIAILEVIVPITEEADQGGDSE